MRKGGKMLSNSSKVEINDTIEDMKVSMKMLWLTFQPICISNQRT